MITGLIGASAILFAGTLVFAVTGLIENAMLKLILTAVSGIAYIVCTGFAIWCIKAYHAFSYDGKRQLSKQIVDGIAEYISVPEGGKVLDVGCGSGALTIACARKNPGGMAVGIDRWGKEYASFSKQLCENNAKAEGTENIIFVNGNAIKLGFSDESFDAVTSNYVYHNISGKNKQELLLETLRVLKKGGIFAIHDIMSPRRYGDMNAFVKELKTQGYRKVELIDTGSGMFVTQKEAKQLKLEGSTILYGIK
jgi:ubiquinone/menaquinone biosynthesis C-methylase UbiE